MKNYNRVKIFHLFQFHVFLERKILFILKPDCFMCLCEKIIIRLTPLDVFHCNEKDFIKYLIAYKLSDAVTH